MKKSRAGRAVPGDHGRGRRHTGRTAPRRAVPDRGHRRLGRWPRAFRELLRHLPQVGITVEDETRLALGQRAQTVRELLLKAGLDGSLVEVESHGERSLLRKTPDNTPEPRNRRVEITIR